MNESLRVRDLIGYLEREDPDAKVKAGGVPLSWEPPQKLDDKTGRYVNLKRDGAEITFAKKP